MNKFLLVLFLLCSFLSHAQEPERWIFGKSGGLDFLSNQAQPSSYGVDNCYSPTSSKCDAGGNLLFYCDGRNIKDRNGNVMAGSQNPIWTPTPHQAMVIFSTVVPITGDTNRYYVFMLTPSNGISPFGAYYQNAVTYSVVDMSLNNGNGGIDPSYSNVLLDTNSNGGFIVAKGKDCNYWLVIFKMGVYQQEGSHFAAFKITDTGIEAAVKSAVNIPGFITDGAAQLKMTYAPDHKKIIECYGSRIIVAHNFDDASGIVSNGNSILDLAEFRNSGGGATFPSVALSANEKFLYLLGYPYAGTGPNGASIILRQYPIDFSLSNPTLTSSTIIFQTSDGLYQTSAAQLPYHSQNCDISLGPDNKIYMFYNTGMSFMGRINQPDNSGISCNFEPQGVTLLPNTFGSYFLPPPNNERVPMEWVYRRTDTVLCLASPLTLRPNVPDNKPYDYKWNDGSTTETKTITAEGIYWVKSTGDCAGLQYLDSFVIKNETAEKCNCKLFVPNAFSPNNDQENDIFRPVIASSCIHSGFQLKIFNRWGQLVFQSFDLLKGWDGKHLDQYADMGTYFYYAAYKDFHGNMQIQKGDFLLIR